MASAATESDWLDIGETPRIVSAAKLPGEKKRGKAMVKSPLGKSRTWLCDGEYVWLRRKQANAETIKRHEAFISAGEYKYVETQGDVEVYKLQPASPFRRKEPINLAALDFYNLRRQAALAAVRRDWVTYIDALEEVAGRIKGSYDPGFAKTMFEETLQGIEASIEMRGGPAKKEIDREVQAARQRHGLSRNRQVLLPQ